MKIPMQKAVDSVIGYMSGEVAKIPNLKDRFLMFALLGAVRANPSAVVANYENALKAVGVVDADNMVCTDAIRSAMDMAFSNVPSFSVMGFTFSQPDALELLRRMEA